MSDSVREDSPRYVGPRASEYPKDRDVSEMTQEQRWAYYASDEFTGVLTRRFHRAKKKALASGSEFYRAR
jgi:hypothetical protein